MQIVANETTLKLIAEENFSATFSEAIHTRLLEGLKQSKASQVVLDLKDTEIIDAMGLKLLLGLHQTCLREKRHLRLLAAHPHALKTITLYQLDQFIELQECQP